MQVVFGESPERSNSRYTRRASKAAISEETIQVDPYASNAEIVFSPFANDPVTYRI